jgi:uncharacterized protein YjiS (DUF1127 family)
MSTIYRRTGLAQTTVSQRRDSSALKNFWGAFQEWRKWERLRRDLCNLSDRELMDIEITRGEIDYVALPANSGHSLLVILRAPSLETL